VAYQNIKKPYITNNGINYNLQYDPTNGLVQIIQENASTGTQPIYRDGSWLNGATSAGIVGNARQTYHSEIQTLVRAAYNNIGGPNSGAILPNWALSINQGQPPGQTQQDPTQNQSPLSGNTGGGGFGQIVGSIFQPTKSIGNVSVTNGTYGPDNEFKLFRGRLAYPIDLNSKLQDTLIISQYQYQPPAAGQFLSGNAQDILTAGLQRGTDYNRERWVGTVFLPMPNSLSEEKRMEWGPDNMDNLTAGVMSDVMNQPGKYAGVAGLSAAASMLFGGSPGSGAATGATGTALVEFLRAAGSSDAASALVGATGVSKMLQAAQFGVDVESILSRSAGIVPNNNLELLFNSPTLRAFSLSYRLTARSEPEAVIIRKIIRFFKQGSSPKKKRGAAGTSSYFIATPNVYRLQFTTIGNSEIEGVSRFKTCALINVQTDYTPDGVWAAYDRGQPVSTRITLSFSELEPIFDTDYQSGAPAAGRDDLTSLPDSAVGY
jgi:hypothetical protein